MTGCTRPTRPALLLLAAALTACLSACNGVTPDPFTPFEDPSVLLTELPDDEGQLKFLVLGDWGRRGTYYQTEIARQMGVVAERIGAEFVTTTGDNFYTDGVEGPRDSEFEESFDDVYTAPSLHIPWHPTLGNHDYQGDVEAQIAYSARSDRWEMPARYYSFVRAIDDTTHALFLFIDTITLLPADYEEVTEEERARELEWIERTLAESDADWKLVVGHHPLYSAGKHGDTEELIPVLAPLFERYGVQAYFAGHDHNLQYLETEEFDQIVSGGGSRLGHAGPHRFSSFAMVRPGFTVVALAPARMLVQFVDHRGNILYGEIVEVEMDPETVPQPAEPESADE